MKASLDLFHYSLDCVTPADIESFSFPDPGYPAYVAHALDILHSRELPEKAVFDFTENLSLNQHGHPSPGSYNGDVAKRYLRFQQFMNATALALLTRGEDSSWVSPNNAAIVLVDCSVNTRDAELSRLLPPALQECHDALEFAYKADPLSTRRDVPFFSLANLLLASVRGVDQGELSLLAEKLIEEEKTYFDADNNNQFLYGCAELTVHALWKRYVDKYVWPGTPALNLLREVLLVK